MSLAIEQRRDYAQRHLLWRDFLSLDAGDPLLLQALEFFLRKRRMQNQVGINVERSIHGALQRVEADQRPIQTCRRREVSAERFQLFADFQRISRWRTFFEHALLKARRSWSIRRVSGISAVDHQSEVHDRSRMTLRQHDLQPIRELRLLQCRQLERLRTAHRGFLRAIEFGFSFKVSRIRMHFQNVIAIAQPLVCRLLHAGRRGFLHPSQIIFVAIRIARISLAACDQIALAPKAANTFHNSHVTAENLSLGNLQFGFCRTILQEILQFLAGFSLNFHQIAARVSRQREIKLPADLICGVVCIRAGRDLVFVDQAFIKP